MIVVDFVIWLNIFLLIYNHQNTVKCIILTIAKSKQFFYICKYDPLSHITKYPLLKFRPHFIRKVKKAKNMYDSFIIAIKKITLLISYYTKS